MNNKYWFISIGYQAETRGENYRQHIVTNKHPFEKLKEFSQAEYILFYKEIDKKEYDLFLTNEKIRKQNNQWKKSISDLVE